MKIKGHYIKSISFARLWTRMRVSIYQGCCAGRLNETDKAVCQPSYVEQSDGQDL